MFDVFVSCSTKDKDVVRVIGDYLKESGIKSFLALDKGIKEGENYAKSIVAAIGECKVLIVVVSSSSIVSEHVLNELEIAMRQKHYIVILPFFIEDIEPSNEMLYYIGRKQFLFATDGDISMHLPRLVETVKEKLCMEISYKPTEYKPTRVMFDYHYDSGIMINSEDHARNISFRHDTLLSIMKEIFDGTSKIKKVSENLFFSVGRNSGKRFAERIQYKWGSGNGLEDIQGKLKRWCEFDSRVGWGKFDVNIDYDSENDIFSGKLSIKEPFLVDKSEKRKVCSFVKGYCIGVIETLLENVDVKLKCIDCPMDRVLGNVCEFDIELKLK